MPTLISLGGLKVRVYTREHEPMHVHVIGSDGAAKFNIEDDITLVDNKGLSSKEISKSKEIIKTNIDNIRSEWKRIVRNE
ncbi:hypothetical protein FACS189452_00970 [Bacteroidia bacterium]|nr:hypothetical protein FACS189452_00970 [Bacteroidia bacterium]